MYLCKVVNISFIKIEQCAAKPAQREEIKEMHQQHQIRT